MNILAIDTSGATSSAALLMGETLAASFDIQVPLTHSQTILCMVNSLFQNTHLSLDQVDLFAAAVGPGSFTGLRIGLSATKGLAFAKEKPCIGISTLEGLAYNLAGFPGVLCPVMDARRAEVYTGLYHWKGGELSSLFPDMACPITVLGEHLLPYRQQPIWLVGDGAALTFQTLSAHFPSLSFAPPNLRYQKAASLCQLAQKKVQTDPLAMQSPAHLLPNYLRLSQAERERLEKESHFSS